MQCDFEIKCEDPLQNVEAVVPLPTLPATAVGTYALELLCDDEPIGSFRVKVDEINLQGPEDADH